MKDSTGRPPGRRGTLARHGPIGQFELLRAILAVDYRGKQLDTLVAYLSQRYGTLADVLSASAHQLREDNNVGPVAAAAIESLNCIMIEAAFAPLRTRSVLDDERSVLVYLHLLFGRRAEEEVWILFLDAKSAVISQAQIAKGTGCRVEIRPKTIARLAIVAGATAIIVAHNHPSGDPKPSGEDFQTTQEIEKFCASVNVRLLNHYIMSFGKWHSFRNSGHLMEIPLDIRLLV